jgi:hypothetical protein
MPLMLGEEIDDVQGALLVTYKETLDEFSVKNPWLAKDILLAIKRDDILNIRGLGRLKVMQVEHYPSVHQFINMVEVVVTAKWISDWWNPTTTTLINNTLAEINKQMQVDMERKLWEEA